MGIEEIKTCLTNACNQVSASKEDAQAAQAAAEIAAAQASSDASSAKTAKTAAQTAQTAVEIAKTAAQTAQDEAENARDAAALSAGLYDTVDDGLAATADGEYFTTVSDTDFNFLILYKNNAGLAELVKKYPSIEYLKSVWDTESYQDIEYAYAIIDELGYVLFGLNKDGTCTVKKIDINGVITDQEDAGDYEYIISDRNKNILFGVKEDGEATVRKIDIDHIKIAEEEYPDDYCYVISDRNKNILFGIKNNGNVVANGLSAPTTNADSANTTILSDDKIFIQENASIIEYSLDGDSSTISPDAKLLSADNGIPIFNENGILKYRNYIFDKNYDVFTKTNKIVCWGDSLTAGTGSSGGVYTYPGVLASVSSTATVNKGVGGQTAKQIIARQGGEKIIVSVSGNNIPATGSVDITSKNINILYEAGNYTGTAEGILAGVHGTMSTDSSGNWTFTRTTDGVSTSCPENSIFYPDTNERDEYISVFWIGRNNLQDVAQTIDMVQKGVDFLKPLSKKFVIMTVTNGNGEYTGTDAHTACIDTRDQLFALYPNNTLDIRQILVDSYDPTIQQDVDDHNGDTVPGSIRSDSVHLNDAGYEIVANEVFNFMQSKQWF